MKILKWIRRVGKSLSNLLRETRAELKKVIWPSFGQVRVFALITLAMIAGVGAVLWGTDVVMSLLVGLVLKR
ncbi:MAG: preprotein translocase subunit SecE [Bacillota bacterium]|jgi:preprotein translocase SecE subunit